ncbi:hypothetical protein UlMin_016973 [Ulmus minor]
MEDCVDPTSHWRNSFEIPEMAADGMDGSEDEGRMSEDELNYVDSEEDEGQRKPWVKKSYPKFNPETNLKDPKFQVDQTFTIANWFRKAVRSHALKQRRAVVFEKNDPNRIRVRCKVENCGWEIFASIYRFLNSKMHGHKYVNHWRMNPNWNFNRFAQQLRDDYGVDASLWQYHRIKRHTMKLIERIVKDQYAHLWDYCAELRRKNPGSTIQVKCNLDGDKPMFQRIYVCLTALRKGWIEGCRMIIGLDGCFIKGLHKWQLLTAIGVDPNNQMFPIAYALVKIENR